MDGRPHPGPNAPHTWMGFSTGRYDGDMLIVETTHLKQGWVRRNGVPMSDQAKMTEYMVRNGEVMTHIVVLVDPVYLTEPLVKSQEFVRSTRELPARTWLWVCDPVRRDRRLVQKATCRPTCRMSIRSRTSSPAVISFRMIARLRWRRRRCIRSSRTC